MADVLISDLSFSQPLSGDELLPIVQNGTSYKVSVSAVGGTGGDTENINGRCNNIGIGYNYSSIVGGECNDVDGNCSFIGGGKVNLLSADFGFIGGGTGNTVYAPGGFIGGGSGNDICSNTCLDTIGGGNSNTVSSGFKLSFIGGGLGNIMVTCNSCASADPSFNNRGNVIVGGVSNSMGTPGSPLKGLPPMTKDLCHNTIVGGYFNKIYKFGTITEPLPDEDIESKYSFVGGGLYNRVNGNHTTIVGGTNNKIYSGVKSSFIGGGAWNTVRSVPGTSGSNYSTIVGGFGNTLSGNCSVILGGNQNTLSADFGFIGGGATHTINSIGGIIGGGSQNTIEENTFIDTIGGGNGNCVGASFKNSFIGGGLGNTMFNQSPDKFCSSFSSYTNSIISGRENNLGGYNFTKTMCSNTIAGGQFNGIGGICLQTYPNEDFTANHNFIGGGKRNAINGHCSGIAAGYQNEIFSNLSGAFIGGGVYNTIRNVDGASNGHHSSILGGKCNTISHDESFIAGTGITSVSSNMLHANTLYLSAAALPTTDPGIPGVVWRDGTDLKISV
jgi:hypothetical protein